MRHCATTAVITVAIATALRPTTSAAQKPTVDRNRPNIVWIWADNLAYADLSCYGSRSVRTPNIDRLAAEGVRFTQFYVAHVVCSPSRAALLTGRQPFRVGIIDVLRPDGPSGLPADEVTLAEALGQQGYACAAFGKWHLGDRREFLPLQHGFDHYFGLPYSMDMLPTLLYRDNEIVDRLDGDRVNDVTIRLVDAAAEFIATNSARPFFVYFSHTLPHPPLNLPASARTEGRSIYDDAIEHLDQQTGRLLEAVDKHSLAERTLVVFTSDNGPMLSEGDTGGLRGRIRDAYEGGIRVPLVARWPGVIPAGRTEDRPAIAYDFFPTLVNVAGGQLPDDRTYDGQDIWPLLFGRGEFTRRSPFVWVYRDAVSAIRSGRFKLHLADRNGPLDPPQLYDVERDPQESHPLADDRAAVRDELQAAAASFQRQIPKAWNLYYPVRDPEKRPSGVRRQ